MRAWRSFSPIALTLALAGCGDGGHQTGGGGRGGADASGLGGLGGSGGGPGGQGGTAGTAGTAGMGGTPDGIVVDTPSGQVASEAVDGHCDILEAVAAATTGQSVHECANPNGSLRIILKDGASYPTGKTLRFAAATPMGLPIQIGLADGATGRATIVAADPWLLDPGDPPTSCLVNLSGGAAVELADVTLTQVPSLSVTGACVTRGTLRIRRASVIGFRRGGVIDTCLPETGCDFDAGGYAILQIANALVDGNSTAGDGGGIYSAGFGATVVVYHSSIVHNTAAGAGGGLYFGGGWNTHVIRGSTVSGNTADVGGGVMVKFACSNTYLNVFNTTIADNTAQGTGGGIQFEPADLQCAKQDVQVYSSIVAGNHSLSTFESNINAGWFTEDLMGNLGTFSCFGGSLFYVAPGYPPPTEIDLPCPATTRDPHIGPLMPMGGVGDLPVHPLLAGSPAIDGASNDPNDQTLDDERNGWIPFVDPPLTDDWTLFDRMADGDGDGRIAPDLGAVEMNPRWQTELLIVAAKGPSPHKIVVAPVGFDRGAGTEYAATSATGEFVTYRLPIPEPGYYDVTAGVLAAPAGGKVQIAVANDPNGPWTDLGVAQDAFAQSPTFATFGPFPAPLFAIAGEKLIRFTVTGKNTASGGYQLSLDYVDARKSTKACPVAQIASGTNHTCALTAAGAVRCWGANDAGQLGDGTMAAAWRAPAVDAATGVAAIAAGARHTCALTTAGGVRCWGANDAGQLGSGGTAARATPPASDVMTGVMAIAAGARHTCALTTAGGVRCWGANDAGQLGDGSATNRLAPPTADVLTGVKAIAAGGSVTCALMQAGGVRCWGANTFGQLGDGTIADRATPPTSDVFAGAASLSVGDGHTCAVTTAGGVRCWGHNRLGQLGDGTFLDALAPPATDALAGARDVAAGPNFTCALTAAGGVRCWGYNSDGQIGDDTPNATERPAPAATDVLGGVQGLSVGSAHVCARTATGGVRCWGANAVGQLGDGLTPEPAATPPPLDVVSFTGTCR